MNILIKLKLRKIAKDSNPDPRFVRALELKIKEEISPARPMSFKWKTAAISLTSASMMLMGAGSYAYSADAVVPGHTLYPVRETMENARVKMAWGKKKEMKARLHQLKRRHHEQMMLESRSKTMPEYHLDRFVKTRQQIIETAKQMDPATKEEWARRIQEIESNFSENTRLRMMHLSN